MPCRLCFSSDFTGTIGFPETRILTVSSQSAEGEFERKVSWETASTGKTRRKFALYIFGSSVLKSLRESLTYLKAAK